MNISDNEIANECQTTEIEVTQVAGTKSAKPPDYKVILLNDDYTPMDFVVEILKRFFAMDHVNAVQVMLQIHRRGSAVCGTYSRDVAETKVKKVNHCARENQYPLMCKMEVD